MLKNDTVTSERKPTALLARSIQESIHSILGRENTEKHRTFVYHRHLFNIKYFFTKHN